MPWWGWLLLGLLGGAAIFYMFMVYLFRDIFR